MNGRWGTCASGSGSQSFITVCRCRYKVSPVFNSSVCTHNQTLVRCVIFLRIASAANWLITGALSCKEALLTAKQPVGSDQVFAQRFAESCLAMRHKVAGIDCWKERTGLASPLVILAHFHCFFISACHTACLHQHLNMVCLSFSLSSCARETNLKFKMGLKVTDERLQEERQLAAFDGECCALRQVTSMAVVHSG